MKVIRNESTAGQRVVSFLGESFIVKRQSAGMKLAAICLDKSGDIRALYGDGVAMLVEHGEWNIEGCRSSYLGEADNGGEPMLMVI